MNAANGLDRNSSWQRTAAVGLVLVQVFVLDLLMESQTFAMAAMGVALAGWLAPRYRLLLNLPESVSYALVVAAFVVKYAYAPHPFDPQVAFIGNEMAHELSSCCVVLQLVTLFMVHYSQRLPGWYLTISGLGLIFSGDIRFDDNRRELLLVLVGTYFALWTMYASTSRTTVEEKHFRGTIRRLLLGGVLLTAMTIGWGASVLVLKYGSNLDRVLNAYMVLAEAERTDGFSGFAGLSDVSDWKQNNSDAVTLRIESDVRPNYLRGRVFDRFLRDRWMVTILSETIEPAPWADPEPALRPGDHVFRVSDSASRASRAMTIYPADMQTARHCFLPLKTAAVACPLKTLQADANGIVTPVSGPLPGSYVALVNDGAAQRRGALRRECLDLPASLPAAAFALSDQLCRDKPTTAGKIQAVESYFQQNFEYASEIHSPSGVNRLEYFLTQRPAAHCEYFATATVILLRMAGIPARYVTGYVANERNSIDGAWIVRRKDAHAWAEAYDAQRETWVTVDSTPSDGTPAALPTSNRQQFTQASQHLWVRLYEQFRSGAIWSKLVWLLIPLSAFAIIVISLRIARRRRLRTQRRRTRELEGDRRLQKLARERRRLDRFLSRRGMVRSAAETVLQFAGRLESEGTLTTAADLAGWYREYSQLRYQAHPLPYESFRDMRKARERLVRATRRRT